jgi:hypothetical protein
LSSLPVIFPQQKQPDDIAGLFRVLCWGLETFDSVAEDQEQPAYRNNPQGITCLWGDKVEDDPDHTQDYRDPKYDGFRRCKSHDGIPFLD